MTAHNKDRRRPVFSETLPPSVINSVRELARQHNQPISREIQRIIEEAVSSQKRRHKEK